ncbi:wHTH domain-containing protein [Actinokineospora diospyrosa]|uniref:Histidine kinase-, DNA gyrase B-, and HSP90-like ATPase n=1 Tax=Actinokineospora diospyrosa TaxID=103728 RepID=A0ABT1I8E9_9PSEU|nr:hypothetical protein [Actinokineospora diospyrosa]MCP2268901.1 Histidine kinase-, DNA gyrase B-, and HSP90-like ATPase [Actinokineospora diospyrosa]
MAAADVAELFAKLGQLWEESGRPAQKDLAVRCDLSEGQVRAILGGTVKNAPSWDVVRAVVQACAGLATTPSSVTTELPFWRDLHGRAEATPPQATSTDWTDLVRLHPAWTKVADAGPALAGAMSTAEQLFAAHNHAEHALAGDPWRDEAFPKRMTDRVAALIATIREHEPLEFSPLEAALLSLAPLVHQTRTARAAASLTHVDPTDLSTTGDKARESYERHLDGQQERRLVARAAQRDLGDRQAAAEEIGWWLFHRWVETHPLPPTTITLDDPQTRKVLIDVLDRMTRLLRLSPGDLGNPARLDLRPKTSHLGGVVVRERLLGLLVAVAHCLAVEPITLSPVVVEHLGVPNPVDLGALRTTLDYLSWEPVHIGVGMVAECHHEAVMEALRDHVSRADAVFAAIHAVAQDDAHLQPLLHLPARASADRVEPASTDGVPAFTVPVTRFRLDETRVRELLMGQQLYGDQSLAIRELYQNALDACRYRQARQEYLDRPWTGNITFEQGVDEQGRNYLRCTDNGIGMGDQELREVFSQAGIRFADRPEFLEEQAEWAERDIHLYPNSRFGIGVLSYFMLADEIEVTTCRMDRHGGRPGPQWHVRIVGPGHLFRITVAEEHGAQPGTSVTLYLRDGAEAPSCVDVLDRLLGIAEFTTTAEHDGVALLWEPYTFRSRTGYFEPFRNEIQAGGELIYGTQRPEGQVVWCNSGGGLLVDGLHARPQKQSGMMSSHAFSASVQGALVNLTRSWTPKLTVDRTTVLDDVSQRVEQLLTESTTSLLSTTTDFLSHTWLNSVAMMQPRVADIITTSAIEMGMHIQSAQGPRNIAATGFFPADQHLLTPRSEDSDNLLGFRRRHFSSWILLWRLLAHYTELLPERWAKPVRPALPTDCALLESLSSEDGYAIESVRLPVGRIAQSAGKTGMSVRLTASRLTILGYQVDSIDALPDEEEVNTMDYLFLSTSGRGVPPWLDASEVVPSGHIALCSRRTRVSPQVVVKRLSAYSFAIQRQSSIQFYLETDLLILSRNLNRSTPWLDDDKVAPSHVAKAAELLKLPAQQVQDRLSALGYQIDTADHEAHTSVECKVNPPDATAEQFQQVAGTIPDQSWSSTDLAWACIQVAFTISTSLADVIHWAHEKCLSTPALPLPLHVPSKLDAHIFQFKRSCEIILTQGRAPRYLLANRDRIGFAVEDRLDELGIRREAVRADQENAELLKEFDSGREYDPDQRIPIRQVLGHALARRIPVAEVARRLAELDYEVEPVDEAISRLMERVPRLDG